MAKRTTKTKPEIKQDIQKIQAASRMRDTIRSKVHPFLLELNDTIGFTKVFLQTSATTVENVFNRKQTIMKISDILPELKEIFTTKDEKLVGEYNKYLQLFEILKDESIYDFNVMIQSMPRVIEQFYTQEIDKNPIMEMDIEKILG